MAYRDQGGRHQGALQDVDVLAQRQLGTQEKERPRRHTDAPLHTVLHGRSAVTAWLQAAHGMRPGPRFRGVCACAAPCHALVLENAVATAVRRSHAVAAWPCRLRKAENVASANVTADT